jgi:hypothetical protein
LKNEHNSIYNKTSKIKKQKTVFLFIFKIKKRTYSLLKRIKIKTTNEVMIMAQKKIDRKSL